MYLYFSNEAVYCLANRQKYRQWSYCSCNKAWLRTSHAGHSIAGQPVHSVYGRAIIFFHSVTVAVTVLDSLSCSVCHFPFIFFFFFEFQLFVSRNAFSVGRCSRCSHCLASVRSNSIISLKEVPFSYRHNEDTLATKQLGPPRPNLTIKQVSTKGGKSYNWGFPWSCYDQETWLAGCEATNSLFCYTCTLFHPDGSTADTIT